MKLPMQLKILKKHGSLDTVYDLRLSTRVHFATFRSSHFIFVSFSSNQVSQVSDVSISSQFSQFTPI